MVVLFGEGPHDGQCLVEVAVDGHDPSAGHERLEELALRDLALGQTTMTSIPAAAPYAAAEAEVLPVDAQAIAVAPASIALATATTMPRSLNEPVRFMPSSLRCRFGTPMAAPSRVAWTSGVAPSPRVIEGVAAVIGRKAR